MRTLIRALVRTVPLPALMLAGCHDFVAPVVPIEARDPLLAQIQAMGFRADMVEDRGDYYLVEGDIKLNKKDLARSAPAIPGPLFQYHTTNTVSNPGAVSQIRVDLSGLASHPGWYNAAVEALTHWNSIPNSYVRMVQGTPADITFQPVSENPGLAGWAKPPASGAPGDTVYLNLSFWPGFSPSHAVYLRNAVHELGHTLGFRHTNWNSADCRNHWNEVISCYWNAGPHGAHHISGTPTSGGDAASVMNGLTSELPWNGFSTHDRNATATLYPLPRPLVSVSYTIYGHPVISWTPVPGASMYYVILEVERWSPENGFEIDRISVAATTGTTATDGDRTYTAIPMCDFPGEVQEFYRYRVETYVISKVTGGEAGAEVGNC